jgi:hypothetical protein
MQIGERRDIYEKETEGRIGNGDIRIPESAKTLNRARNPSVPRETEYPKN